MKRMMKVNISLIAIDMDGTMLDDDHKVSERNKEAINRATEKGVKVVISTGRIYTSARYYSRLLGISTPIIACNGAYVCEHDRSKVIYEKSIPLNLCKSIIKLFEEAGVYYHLFDNDNFYTKELNHSSRKYYEWNLKQKEEDRININIIESPMSILEEKDARIYKFVVVDEDQEKLDYVRDSLLRTGELEIVSSWKHNIEIMAKGVSKGKALEELNRILNISKDSVMAIGDNYNDISMLNFAGLPISMGNGEPKVKELAKYITDTNNKDGVAKAIEKFVL